MFNWILYTDYISDSSLWLIKPFALNEYRYIIFQSCTRGTDRNATMLRGNQSAASPYLLWGFMVLLTSDEIRLPSDFSIVFTISEFSVWVHLWVTAQNNAFLSVILSWKNLHVESVAESSTVNFPILLMPDNTTIYGIAKEKKLTTQVLCKIRSLKWIKGYW